MKPTARPLAAIIIALALAALAGCSSVNARGWLLLTLNEGKPLPAGSPAAAMLAGATPTATITPAGTVTGILTPIPAMPVGTTATR